eukprot:jgi/Mesen1/4226/ME000022S03518
MVATLSTCSAGAIGLSSMEPVMQFGSFTSRRVPASLPVKAAQACGQGVGMSYSRSAFQKSSNQEASTSGNAGDSFLSLRGVSARKAYGSSSSSLQGLSLQSKKAASEKQQKRFARGLRAGPRADHNDRADHPMAPGDSRVAVAGEAVALVGNDRSASDSREMLRTVGSGDICGAGEASAGGESFQRPGEGKAGTGKGFNPSRRMLVGMALAGLGAAQAADAGLAEAAASLAGKPANASGMGWILGDVTGNPALLLAERAKESRVYDATKVGEPVPLKDKGKVIQKLLAARVVYLGEAEKVPDPTDKVVELEIVKKLRDECFAQGRPVTVGLSALPRPLQPQLNLYQDGRMSDAELRAALGWHADQWQAFLPLFQYCRDSGVRLYALGCPDEARSVADFSMAQAVDQAMSDGSVVGLLVVITGASHVRFGARGRGVPARVAIKLRKTTQVTVLLNPERQPVRREGQVPEADLMWYSGVKACKRNCFDRAEVARVMGAAGRSRDALPQDIQVGIDYGLISPDTLRSFLELDSQPLLAEATRRFQGLRERWLADPRFLQRLCIEEAISISTTLLAQYQKRGARFWSELEYVITDTSRGAVVDFFTVWLPAPTLSFRNLDASSADAGAAAAAGGLVSALTGLLGSLPDNAFQRASRGEEWDLQARALAVVVGGVKLSLVGFVSSIGTVAISNALMGFRQRMDPAAARKSVTTRPPVVKTAAVYGGFLGTSANLRYQAIAGLVEHWGADYLLAGNPLLGGILSFAARTANSYWGTGQWVDLARRFKLQAHKDEADSPAPSPPASPSSSSSSSSSSPEQPSPSLSSALLPTCTSAAAPSDQDVAAPGGGSGSGGVGGGM